MRIYDFIVKNSEQIDISLSQYSGKVLLIVNTATKCGLTPQYEELETLYKKYKEQGFEVLDFPCNQFLEQAPGSDEEITSFCTLNYGTSFPRFAKIEVNGENAAPLYTWLKEQAGKEEEDETLQNFVQKLKELGYEPTGNSIKWNFTKFLIDRQGNVTGRFAPTRKPSDFVQEIENLLSDSPDGLTCSAEFTEGCK